MKVHRGFALNEEEDGMESLFWCSSCMVIIYPTTSVPSCDLFVPNDVGPIYSILLEHLVIFPLFEIFLANLPETTLKRFGGPREMGIRHRSTYGWLEDGGLHDCRWTVVFWMQPFCETFLPWTTDQNLGFFAVFIGDLYYYPLLFWNYNN